MKYPRTPLAGIAAFILIFTIAAAYAEEHEHMPPAHGQEECEGHDHAEHQEEAANDPASEDPQDSTEAGHEDEGLRLTPEQRKRFGIVVQTAGPGSLRNEVSLPGEIVFNEDRVVHVTPRVAGIAREVLKTVGDRVAAGEVMAVMDSRELADAKAEYLAAKARAALAGKVHEREASLRAQKISAEQELLEAEQALAEARIVLRTSEQKLHALGLPGPVVAALDGQHEEAITRYEIRAPLDGVVTEKHIALGESLAADADIFTVADTASVWINLAVHLRNLPAVRAGQEVMLRLDHDGAQAQGTIAMVTPFVDASTRSATARIVLDNTDGRWTPGTFATGFMATSEDNLPVVVPRHAVQNLEGRDIVFVEQEGVFEITPVTLGRADRTSVEITTGLAAGARYAAEGAFQLKATVVTSALDSHAGHGH